MRYCKVLFFFIFIYFVNTQFVTAQQTDSLRRAMSNTTLFPVKKDTLPLQEELIIRRGGDSIVQKATDSTIIDTTTVLKKKRHTPRGATLRSLAIPGWGQAYNHQYWKVPLAVAAVGIPIYIYISNTSEYNKAQFAYKAVYLSLPASALYPGATGDNSQIAKMDPRFLTALNQVTGGDMGNTSGKISYLTFIQSYRNTFRQYRDYSILAILGLWGLQVADATVFGHLRDFDVSPDISMHVSPTYFPYTKTPGIAINFDLKYRK
jgi:hypothetical protein